MSEAEQKTEAINEEAKAELNQPTEDTIARGGGWKPEKEWAPDDPKRPPKFMSAETFNARGEFIGRLKAQDKRINDMETNFNTRIENSNKLHQVQMEAQKSELIRKRDDAIDAADRETANRIQGDIDKLAVPEVAPAVNNEQVVIDSWNKDNPWITEDTPKAAYGQSKFAAYQNAGHSAQTCIDMMQRDIEKAFPDINPNRQVHPFSEGGSKPGAKRSAAKLTMNDLTNNEIKYYQAMPGAWKSEAEYLQAVQDTRSES